MASATSTRTDASTTPWPSADAGGDQRDRNGGALCAPPSTQNDEGVYGFFGEYYFLSNFFPAEIKFMGIKFRSVEHAFQAHKYPLEERSQFTEVDADEAKRLGRAAPNFNGEYWDRVRDNLMFSLVLYKFSNNEELREKLLATGGKYLEETNDWDDHYWGVCNGEGDNKMGKTLMTVREIVR
ncbi:MAG: Swarming motility protein ybiA [Parcubacteria group bacterium GW2011_GWA2_46_10]|nr:MAG: Swarming motility protein ybiA [Parcubacteria group bacterium GW2011_GWA2_46_10]